jgi:large subunit ribosomal protein L31
MGKICEFEGGNSQQPEQFGRSTPTNIPKKQTKKPEKTSSPNSDLKQLLNFACQHGFECYFLPPFEMKKDIHPETYRPVVFKDSASGFTFLSQSCARSKQSATWEDGNEYPLVVLGISSASHPFYTGQQVFVDTAGRVDKFQQRLAKTKAAQEEAAAFKKKRR